MALESDGGAGRKRRREDDERGEQGESAAKVDPISALPEPWRLHILTLLPLKAAIRLAVLSRGWRDLWKRRWGVPSSLSYKLKPRQPPSPQEVLDEVSLKGRERRRLDRLSLTLVTSRMRSYEVTRCIEDATERRVEDLRIDLRNKTVSLEFVFHFPKSSSLLAHLSLRRVRISDQYYDKSAKPFYALEAIHLYSVVFGKDSTLSKMVALCPRLRVLNLHRCGGVGSITIGREGRNLRSLTVAECLGNIRLDGVATASSLIDAERRGVTGLDAAAACSLRLFRYSGEFLSSFCLPGNASLSDLYICFGAPKAHKVFDSWFNNGLPNLSNLTVLTFCSNALQVCYFLLDFVSFCFLTYHLTRRLFLNPAL